MKKYIALQLHKSPQIDAPYTLKLPSGCAGLMFVFTTKKAARSWCGKKVNLQEIEVENHEPNKLTAATLKKTEEGKDLHEVENAEKLIEDLDND